MRRPGAVRVEVQGRVLFAHEEIGVAGRDQLDRFRAERRAGQHQLVPAPFHAQGHGRHGITARVAVEQRRVAGDGRALDRTPVFPAIFGSDGAHEFRDQRGAVVAVRQDHGALPRARVRPQLRLVAGVRTAVVERGFPASVTEFEPEAVIVAHGRQQHLALLLAQECVLAVSPAGSVDANSESRMPSGAKTVARASASNGRPAVSTSTCCSTP